MKTLILNILVLIVICIPLLYLNFSSLFETMKYLSIIAYAGWILFTVDRPETLEEVLWFENDEEYYDRIGQNLMNNFIVQQRRRFIINEEVYHDIAEGGPYEGARVDNQNVHDSGVTAHIKQAINALQSGVSEHEILKDNQLLQAIIDAIFSAKQIDNNQRQLAITSLKKIKWRNGLVNGINEWHIMALVWARINQEINSDNRDNLVESLVLQLVDCLSIQDTGAESMFCVTGSVTRIVQSLEKIDNEGIVDIKPLWAIKEEIQTYCSQYVDKFLAKLSDSTRNHYNNCTDEADQIVTKINQRIKDGLMNRLKRRYLVSGILTKEKFNQYVQPCLDVFN